MAHTTFYRKYRSADFDELVGQDHIIQTLSNAITYDRLAHAYIFSGPRGTGKTSSARILAKSLNCRQGKSVTPCGICDLCKKITVGQSVDVIEIDAASNTGVDNIRVLNDQVGFAPVECRYRMFIIDEAHMLSSGAFNALLKTLEEPPANVVFVLATTEPHKIPATIHSRCQHLQFRKLTIDEIVGQLRHIAETESIVISDAALRLVARNASGCMRDGISLLDQIFSFKGTQIEDADVQSILGAANWDSLLRLGQAILATNVQQVVGDVTQMLESGVHPIQLLEDLIELFKLTLFTQYGFKEDGDKLRQDSIGVLVSSANSTRVQSILELFAKTLPELRHFPDPQLLVQIRVVGAAAIQSPVAVPATVATSVAPPPPSVQPSVPVVEAVAAAKASDDMSDHLRRLSQIRDTALNRPVASAAPPAPSMFQMPPVVPKPSSQPVSQVPKTVEPQLNSVTDATPSSLWQQVIQTVKTEKQSLFSVLNQSVLE
ncbi:DNA polymerase III subunit gamma/tau, partial [bacterium]|nr:DNA polymerase III subunit gamma/tau [bacterium]